MGINFINNMGDYTDIFEPTSDKKMALGSKLETVDGRVFRYCQAGATTLAVGKLNQSAAQDSNVQNVTVAASASVGATSITIDSGGAIVANAYEDGYLIINDATGEGQTYRVVSNPALSTAGELTVEIETGLVTAITVDVSEATLVKNPYKDIIVNPTTMTGMVVGVNPVAITALYYGFVQTRGVASCLINGTIAVGSTVAAGATTAGSVDILATGTVAQSVVGKMFTAGTSTEYQPVFLTIE